MDNNNQISIQVNTAIASTQYTVTLDAYIREFVGNTGGPLLGKWEFNINNPNELPYVVWNKARSSIQHGIKFDTNESGELVCSWMDDTPSIENIDIFLQLYDVTSKRLITWQSIDGPKLQSWLLKSIRLYVYKYSSQIQSRESMNIAKRMLINPPQTDRSGASTLSEMDYVSNLLKSRYSSIYDSFDINWGLWANHILSQPRHSFENLLNCGPPASLIHLFRLRSVPAETVLSNLNHVNTIGLDMIRALQLKLNAIKLHQASIDRYITLLDESLQQYEQQFLATSNVIEASNVPMETADSVRIYAEISNQLDYEHMQTSDQA